jgi:hypothetical protein
VAMHQVIHDNHFLRLALPLFRGVVAHTHVMLF